MARPKRIRKISHPPIIKGINPMGYYGRPNQSIQLFYEEYECVHLLDYQGLTQKEVAVQMEISRPTLTRIYSSARKKMATALSEARQVLIEGGKAIHSEDWDAYHTCQSHFNDPLKINSTPCPNCEETYITDLNQKLHNS